MADTSSQKYGIDMHDLRHKLRFYNCKSMYILMCKVSRRLNYINPINVINCIKSLLN